MRMLLGSWICWCFVVMPMGAQYVLAEPRFRMPLYPELDPPPPRSKAEIDALLAGADECEPADEGDLHPLRVVLVAGPKDHKLGEHDYPNWQKVWSRRLRKERHTTIDTAWEFPEQSQIDDSDVLVFYQRGRWDEARAAAIDPFLKRGGGLVYIHWAIEGRGGQEEFAKRIGLASLSGSIRYRHGPIDIDFSHNRDHSIARNFERVRWIDETYWRLTGNPKRLNLLGTSSEENNDWPQFWTIDHKPGRVFVCLPGHYMWTFDDPYFRTLLFRGIAWVGGRNVDRFNHLITLDARIKSR